MRKGNTVVPLSEVQPERIEWLWPGRLPLGKLVIIDGDPGTGKSTLTLDLAARVSSGADWPDGSKSVQGEVLIMSVEDGLADTIAPRLDAAGADRSLIYALTDVEVREKDGSYSSVSPTLPRDIPAIEAEILRYRAQMLIIDPLMAFLGAEIDSFKDQHVRRALTPLSKVAEETGCTIVLVRHLNKGTGMNALQRGGGSIGIIGAARAGYIVARDPNDPELRIFAPSKFNLGPEPSALAYRLVDDPAFGVARVEWESGTFDLSADALLNPPSAPSTKNRSVVWLQERLAGGPAPSAEVEQEAEAAGLSKGQLKAARRHLGVHAYREQKPNGVWMMELREDCDNSDDGYQGFVGSRLDTSSTPSTPSTSSTLSTFHDDFVDDSEDDFDDEEVI